MTSFDRLHITSYLCSKVTIALSCIVLYLFGFENAATLKSGYSSLGPTQGPWAYAEAVRTCIRTGPGVAAFTHTEHTVVMLAYINLVSFTHLFKFVVT